jgi:hypothetical protein
MCSCSDLLVIGSARIAFESYSYMMKMYLLPRLEVVGNLPVRSVELVPVISIVVWKAA